MNDAALIRRVEVEVLDTEYRRFRLLQRHPMRAVGHLLKVFGDGVRDLNRGVGVASFRQARSRVNGMTYGLSHCLRWLLGNHSTANLLLDDRWEVLDEEAAELLRWGISYAFLANDHTAWSRGRITADVDHAEKVITFHTPPDSSAPHFVRQIEAQQATIDDRVQSRPDNVLCHDYHEWRRHLRFQQGQMRGDYGRRPAAVTQAIQTWLAAIVLPDLPEGTALDGFSLADFRAFVGALLPFCLYQCWFEDQADRYLGEAHRFGSQPIAMPMPRFVHWMSTVSELPEATVASIVEMMAFDAGSFHERAIYKPLVVTADRTVLASPRLWSLLDLERLLVGALNTGRRKHVYDRLINDIEASRVRQLAAALVSCPDWEFVCQRTFRPAGMKFTPDIVLWERKTDRVLVVDYKHVTELGGVVEVVNKLGDLSKWLEKMNSYCRSLARSPDLLAGPFPGRSAEGPPARIDGLILSRWPLPLPARPEAISIADWGGFHRLLSKGGPSIESVLSWAERPEISTPAELKVVHQEIHVRDWKYVRSTIASEG